MSLLIFVYQNVIKNKYRIVRIDRDYSLFFYRCLSSAISDEKCLFLQEKKENREYINFYVWKKKRPEVGDAPLLKDQAHTPKTKLRVTGRPNYRLNKAISASQYNYTITHPYREREIV